MTMHRHFGLESGLALLFVSYSSAGYQAAELPSVHKHTPDQHEHMIQYDHANHQQNRMKYDQMNVDEHAVHRAMMAKPGYSVTTERYSVPDVALIDESGSSVTLSEMLDTDQPVALNFIFTTCTTICPVMTATFAQMRRQLGEAGAGLQLVSISIDPEYDRPEVLKEYAKLFGAGQNWAFLTGDGGDIARVLQSFDALSGSKMNHRPLILLKSPQNPLWIRIDGLASSKELAQEVTARLLN